MSTSLSTADTISSGDKFVIKQADNNDYRTASQSVVNTWIQSIYASADPLTQTNVPVTGASLAIRDDGTSTWLLLLPAGTLATLTLTLPALANATDGQTINFTSSQTITALTLAANGATIVGGPTTMGATSPFTLKYDKASLTWYKA